VLSDFQVSIPELGTVSADTKPIVVITSNRTRGLSDAVKRRCLYLHVEPPSFEKERTIVRRKVPELDDAVVAAVCGVTERLREESLLKPPGVAETLDWARALTALDGVPADHAASADDGTDRLLTETDIRTTLGCLLKEVEDVERIDGETMSALLAAAETARE
jgi:MoxR-like ATPase